MLNDLREVEFPSKMHETMPLQISLFDLKDINDEVLAGLQLAYFQNS